jgi:hypothetical protein
MDIHNISKQSILIVIGVIAALISLTFSWILAGCVLLCTIYLLIRYINQSRQNKDSRLLEAIQYLISANINYQLSDAIQELINLRGIDVFSDKSFMNTLADLYNFSKDREEKQIVSELAGSGIIAQICKNRRDKEDAIIAAYNSFINLGYYSRTDKRHITNAILTFLYSIANVTSSDIENYSVINLNYQPKVSKPTFEKFRFAEIFQISIAISILFGSTLFYLAYYHGWWLFFIALFSGFAQVMAITRPNLYDSNTSDIPVIIRRRKFITLIPVYICFILNNLIGIFFLSTTFRDSVKAYIGFDGYINPDNYPSSISGTLLIIIIAFQIILIKSCYSGLFKDKARFNSAIRHTKSALIRVICIIVIGYGLILSIPLIQEFSNDRKKHNEIDQFCQELNDAISKNEFVRNENINVTKKLAFNGIQLDNNISSVDSLYKKIKELSYGFDLTQDYSDFSIVDLKYVRSYLYDNDSIVSKIQINKSGIVSGFEKATSCDGITSRYLRGRVKRVEDTFNNEPIRIDIFESNGKIAALLITHSKKLVFNEYPIYKLYLDKYGAPEKMIKNEMQYKPIKYTYNDFYQGYNYYWTFKNGSIYFDIDKIIYVSSTFISHLEVMCGLYQDTTDSDTPGNIYIEDAENQELDNSKI